MKFLALKNCLSDTLQKRGGLLCVGTANPVCNGPYQPLRASRHGTTRHTQDTYCRRNNGTWHFFSL